MGSNPVQALIFFMQLLVVELVQHMISSASELKATVQSQNPLQTS